MLEKIKNSKVLQMNIKYACAQGLYWMGLCCIVSFASAYLTGIGYSTAAIGFLLAISFLIAAFLQQVVSTAADNARKINVVEITMIFSLILALAFIGQLCHGSKSFGAGLFFIIAATVSTTLQPLLNAMNFFIERHNIEMRFGVARGCGSLFFFVISLIAGNLMNLVSVAAAPVCGLIVTLLLVADLVWIDYDLRGLKLNNKNDAYNPFYGNKDNNLSVDQIKAFIEKYKMFFVFLIGVVGYYFGHVLINNFFYQITVNVGGNTGDNGGILAIQAIVELPAMFCYDKLHKRFGSKVLLATAGIFYFIKMVLTAMAHSVGMLYFSVMFQSLSFAIFIPASVHFVDEIMDQKDAVKGQGFVTIALTIGNLLSSIIGGILFNLVGVAPTLWFGVIVTLAGTILSIYGLVRIKINN